MIKLKYFLFLIKSNNSYMKDENVLKQPKKPTEINNNKFLLIVLNANKIPKNNEDKTFTIKELLI